MKPKTLWLSTLLVLAIAVILVAVSGRATGSLESSWAYENGVQLARAHPAVRLAIGVPIVADAVEGSVRVSGETGDAELTITLRGPGGRGVLHVVARKRYDTWSLERAVIQLDGKPEPIDLGP